MGIDAEKVDKLRIRVQREIDAGLLPSCQFALAQEGELVVFEAYGRATLDSRYLIFSATKAVVASAVWLLIAEGKLDVSRTVASYIPEFASNGKDVVTLEQAMLHTAGFPHAPLGPPRWYDRSERIAQFGRWRLNWEPGTSSEYHATSAHWVLAELIERTSGQDYRAFIHQRITAPLGLPRILGLPPGEQRNILRLQPRGEEATPDELEAVLGVRQLPETEVTEELLLQLNSPENRELGVPGGGGIATAATMALFYQALLHNPGKLWDPELLADVTGRVRNSFPDRTTGVPANRSLGLIIAGDDGKARLRGFGHTQSPRTFGHNGAGGQLCWADPDSGLSFCYLTDGYDRHVIREGRRRIGINSRAALCAS
jgi:CubicO group peptidase (beta-lactamase class C family)